jgi:nitrogen fixation protein FixH
MIKPLTGRGVLLWLFAFFGVIFATNIIFITLSIKTFSGEDEQKPYLQGVQYNDTLARRAAQRKLGWQATMIATRLEDGRVRIRVALSSANGVPETGLSLGGELRHPANENRDRVLKFKEAGPGLYQEDLASVGRGSWDVIVNNLTENAPSEATRRLWVP